MSKPDTTQQLRTQIRNTLYNHEIGFSLANANGRTPEQMVDELIDAILYSVTAHTNKQIAEVLERARQRFHEPIEHDGSYISISVIDKAFDEIIQAERTKLKGGGDE